MSDNLIESLPPELRARYQESTKGMTPTALRVRYGLVDFTADEGAEPRSPRLAATRTARSLAEAAIRNYEGIHRTHWSSMADTTTDPRRAFLRSAQHARCVLDRFNAEAAQAQAALEERAAHLGTVVGNARKAPTSVGDAQIDSDVRAMIRAEKDPSKAAAIAALHPRAVATLPPKLGRALVSASTYDTLVRTYLEKVVPDALADADEVMASVKELATAREALNKDAATLIDFRAAEQMGKHANWSPTSAEAA